MLDTYLATVRFSLHWLARDRSYLPQAIEATENLLTYLKTL